MNKGPNIHHCILNWDLFLWEVRTKSKYMYEHIVHVYNGTDIFPSIISTAYQSG